MRRFILVVLGLMVLGNLVCWASFDFLLRKLSAPPVDRWFLAGFIVLQIVGTAGIVGSRLLGHQPGSGMGRPLLSLFMIWNMLLALPTGAVSSIWAATWWLVSRGNGGTPLTPSWRSAGLIAVALPFTIALVLTAVALWQLDRFRVNRVRLSVPGLPPALKGLTIAHLSDLHIGKLTRGRILDEIVAATNRLEPDLILLTGDLINMGLEDLPRAFEMLRRMKPRYGLFLCEGNHDLIESQNGFEAAVKGSGLPFLLNESATITVNGQAVQILGLRWGEGKEAAGPEPIAALHRLLGERDPEVFTILLAHHPEAFDAAAQAGIPLTLAGHTHGGQLMLSRRVGFGPWLYRYWSGLYEKGASRLMVSNGAGNWFPLRIHAPAEIIQLTLE